MSVTKLSELVRRKGAVSKNITTVYKAVSVPLPKDLHTHSYSRPFTIYSQGAWPAHGIEINLSPEQRPSPARRNRVTVPVPRGDSRASEFGGGLHKVSGALASTEVQELGTLTSRN